LPSDADPFGEAATLLFNAMSFFVMGGAPEEKDKFYVSKIRISRE
jgi:hypothetical protein